MVIEDHSTPQVFRYDDQHISSGVFKSLSGVFVHFAKSVADNIITILTVFLSGACR
jgi:hypothetical protein